MYACPLSPSNFPVQLKLSARVFRCEFIWALLSFAILCWFLLTSTLDDLPAQCNIGGAFVLAFSLVCLVVCLDNDLVAFWAPLSLCIAAALVFGWLERHATVSLVPWERLQDRPMMYVIGIAPITAFVDMSVSAMPTRTKQTGIADFWLPDIKSCSILCAGVAHWLHSHYRLAKHGIHRGRNIRPLLVLVDPTGPACFHRFPGSIIFECWDPFDQSGYAVRRPPGKLCMLTYFTRPGEVGGFDFGRLELCPCQWYLDDNDYTTYRAQGNKQR